MARLLERDEELSVLATAVGRAAEGAGSVVLVGGEAGIGKTSLVRALAERVGAEVSFLLGACEPLSVPVPLAPWREVLDAAGGGEFQGDDRWLLARSLLGALRNRAPAVVVIEDTHWADPLTLDLVRMLAGRVEATGVVLVVTFRDDEAAGNSDLSLMLGDLATNAVVTRIVLRPLSMSAIRTLAGPSGLDVAEVQRVTAGNPFLVAETVAAAGGGLPASVRDAALARAGRLGAASRAVVDAAAVIGQRFEATLLEAVVPGSTDEVEEALSRGVLIADGDRLGFRHELMRAAIEGSISPPRRAGLHAQVLAALVEHPGAADSARLAHHAELAGMREEACGYAIQAAQDAHRLGAMREVALQSERALRLGDGLSASERIDLLTQQAFAANFSGLTTEDALAPAEQAIALAVEVGDAVRHGRALIARAYALWSMDRVADSKAAAEEAIAVLERADDVGALARAHATRVRLDATALDPEGAIAHGPTALELAQQADLEETRIDVAISVGLARGHRGQLESLRILRAACLQARERALVIPTVRSYVNQVFVGALLRQHAFVDATADEARALFDDYQAPIPGYAVESFRARSLLDRGRFDEARAIALSREDWASETPIATAMVGLIAARRGEAGGSELLSRAWVELQKVREGSRHAALRVALAEDAWLRGDQPVALRLYREARESPAFERFSRPAGELALWAHRWGWGCDPPDGVPAAIQLELEGDWRAAIEAWNDLEAPYEAALAALPGDDRAAREALVTLRRLGASATARAFSRTRAERGARPARGPRPSTVAHPAGLTRREQQVLEVLATGASNTAIAGELHLSRRTVAHHVSAILAKLGAGSRLAAVEAARARGLLAENGQPRRPT